MDSDHLTIQLVRSLAGEAEGRSEEIHFFLSEEIFS